MSMTRIFRSGAFGWTMYGLVIVGLIATFWQVMLFEERQGIYFNSGKPQPRSDRSRDLDLLRHALKCRIRVDRFQGLKVRMLHVTSGRGPLFSESGRRPPLRGLFPSPTKRHLCGKMQDVEYLDREFSSRLRTAVLYPSTGTGPSSA